jgi:hypothetical protein
MLDDLLFEINAYSASSGIKTALGGSLHSGRCQNLKKPLLHKLCQDLSEQNKLYRASSVKSWHVRKDAVDAWAFSATQCVTERIKQQQCIVVFALEPAQMVDGRLRIVDTSSIMHALSSPLTWLGRSVHVAG